MHGTHIPRSEIKSLSHVGASDKNGVDGDGDSTARRRASENLLNGKAGKRFFFHRNRQPLPSSAHKYDDNSHGIFGVYDDDDDGDDHNDDEEKEDDDDGGGDCSNIKSSVGDGESRGEPFHFIRSVSSCGGMSSSPSYSSPDYSSFLTSPDSSEMVAQSHSVYPASKSQPHSAGNSLKKGAGNLLDLSSLKSKKNELASSFRSMMRNVPKKLLDSYREKSVGSGSSSHQRDLSEEDPLSSSTVASSPFSAEGDHDLHKHIGKLSVSVIEVDGLNAKHAGPEDTTYWCVITFENAKEVTTALASDRSSPTDISVLWNESFSFDVSDKDSDLTLEVRRSDRGKKQGVRIGFIQSSLDKLSTNARDQWLLLPLMYDDDDNIRLRVIVQFSPLEYSNTSAPETGVQLSEEDRRLIDEMPSEPGTTAFHKLTSRNSMYEFHRPRDPLIHRRCRARRRKKRRSIKDELKGCESDGPRIRDSEDDGGDVIDVENFLGPSHVVVEYVDEKIAESSRTIESRLSTVQAAVQLVTDQLQNDRKLGEKDHMANSNRIKEMQERLESSERQIAQYSVIAHYLTQENEALRNLIIAHEDETRNRIEKLEQYLDEEKRRQQTSTFSKYFYPLLSCLISFVSAIIVLFSKTFNVRLVWPKQYVDDIHKRLDDYKETFERTAQDTERPRLSTEKDDRRSRGALDISAILPSKHHASTLSLLSMASRPASAFPERHSQHEISSIPRSVTVTKSFEVFSPDPDDSESSSDDDNSDQFTDAHDVFYDVSSLADSVSDFEVQSESNMDLQSTVGLVHDVDTSCDHDDDDDVQFHEDLLLEAEKIQWLSGLITTEDMEEPGSLPQIVLSKPASSSTQMAKDGKATRTSQPKDEPTKIFKNILDTTANPLQFPTIATISTPTSSFDEWYRNHKK